MYCPQCGTESQATLQYCRLCGANLKVIGKAVSLSEAIARSDRGPLPKLKEMVKNLKLEHVTDEISGALDKMNEEIMRSSSGEAIAARAAGRHGAELAKAKWRLREKKTQEKRRENLRVKGTISFFSGIGLTIFLYNVLRVLILKLPPAVLVKIPFELDPVVRVLWTVGLIPTLSGLGRFAASFFVRSTTQGSLESMPAESLDENASAPPLPVFANSAGQVPGAVTSQVAPSSVTEHTTELLSGEPTRRQA
jgi:hypothetical protein